MNYQKRSALNIVLLLGLVSLFADIVYEGARSVNGPYLKTLSANATTVGLVVGIGEFLGYTLRLLSGYFSDKTKAYWLFTFLGYGMILSIPLLSFVSIWQIAVVLIILERIGKAIRSPSRDTILSHASKQIGTGFGFGLHEALDQIGAIAGPIIFTVVFIFLGSKDAKISDYQKAYSFLWIPFLLMIVFLILAYIKIPQTAKIETPLKKEQEPDKLSKVFWIYTIFSFVTTLGFTNFALIGYHFKSQNVLSDAQIPLFYAIAMGIDAIVALAIGKIYDALKKKNNNEKAGLNTLIVIPIFSLLIPIFAFSNNYFLNILSVVIFGITIGTHETIMRSSIADITSFKKRGTGYGIFNASYGLAMLLGSTLMGILYDYSIPTLINVTVILEILGFFLFFLMRKSVNT